MQNFSCVRPLNAFNKYHFLLLMLVWNRYEAMFVYLTDQINVTTLKCNEHDENDGPVEDPWIGILDIFGFEHFDQSNGFHTFLINYANEAVQAFYLKFFFEVILLADSA